MLAVLSVLSCTPQVLRSLRRTPKAQVLAEAGPNGLPVGEIAERVHTLGLRDMRSSKAPKVPMRAPAPPCHNFCNLFECLALWRLPAAKTSPPLLHSSSLHDLILQLAAAWGVPLHCVTFSCVRRVLGHVGALLDGAALFESKP